MASKSGSFGKVVVVVVVVVAIRMRLGLEIASWKNWGDLRNIDRCSAPKSIAYKYYASRIRP